MWQRRGATICQALLGKGNELALLTLDRSIGHLIATSLRNVDKKTTLVLEPRYAEQVLARMAAQVEKTVKNNLMPVLVCAPQLRRHLRILTERVLPQLSIVSMADAATPCTAGVRYGDALRLHWTAHAFVDQAWSAPGQIDGCQRFAASDLNGRRTCIGAPRGRRQAPSASV